MPKIIFVSADNQKHEVDVRGGVSVQEAAIQNDVEGIDAECGGGCSCATCHVYVADEWVERVGPAGDLEASMLEEVPNARANSRLSCQIKMTEALDGLVVTTPEHQEGIR